MSKDPVLQFIEEKKERVSEYTSNTHLNEAAAAFNLESNKAKYSYNFTWMGRPIIQYPQDMIAMQEIIWEVKPDLIIETGIAHGGSLIYYASLLELIGKGEVVGIDIDIRAHNRAEIEAHPMSKRIKMLEGSSVTDEMGKRVSDIAINYKNIMVCLDSNHTHNHVLREMELYGPLVSVNSYLVVFDTIVQNLPDNYLPGRAWSRGDNPMTSVEEFLEKNRQFVTDKAIDNKLLISVAPGGYLKRVS